MEGAETSPSQIIDFSDPIDVVAIVLAICSASLSVIGSSTIVSKIVRDKARNGSTEPYDRIIFCLSIGNIFASIYYAMIAFLLAIASPASCMAWGVLFQLSAWAVWYNCLLSFYFLVTLLSQLRRKDYVRKFEPWMHLSGLYFPITAIIGYTQGWFGVMDLGTGCMVVTPIFLPIAWIPIISTFSLMIINYGVIYIVVRKSLKTSNESAENVDGPTLVQKRLMREATSIMFMYVGCFFVAWTPFYILFFFGGYLGETVNSVLLILAALLTPLQGFFNVFIYLKPAYTRFRASNSNKRMSFVLHQALFNPTIPELNYSSDLPAFSNTPIAERKTKSAAFGRKAKFEGISRLYISDRYLAEDAVANPNQALFNSSIFSLSSSSDSSSDAIAEGEEAIVFSREK